MDAQTILLMQMILLTEALTHAVRSWGIFDKIRSSIAARCDFLRLLLACYECTAVWISAGVIMYVYFLDFWPITYIIIIARLATIAHIAIDAVDAWRATQISKL